MEEHFQLEKKVQKVKEVKNLKTFYCNQFVEKLEKTFNLQDDKKNLLFVTKDKRQGIILTISYIENLQVSGSKSDLEHLILDCNIDCNIEIIVKIINDIGFVHTLEPPSNSKWEEVCHKLSASLSQRHGCQYFGFQAL